MTYNNFISQFEILENPPRKKGYHRHHIIPKSEQKEKDDRCVYMLPSQHLWAHILYDRENKTDTAKWLMAEYQIKIENIHSYEDCIGFDEKNTSKQKEQSLKMKGSNNPMHGVHNNGEKSNRYRKHLSEESKKRISENRSGKCVGEDNPMYGNHRFAGENHPLYGKKCSEERKSKISESQKGKHWFNDRFQEVLTFECPEGFVPGRLHLKKSHGQAS